MTELTFLGELSYFLKCAFPVVLSSSIVMFLELPEESQIEVIIVQKGTWKPRGVAGISHDPPF